MKNTLSLLGLALTLAACNSVPAPSTAASAPSLTAPNVAAPQAASTVNLTVGQSRQITLYVNGAPAKPGQIKWTTGNAKVATVSQGGLISATGAGSTTVRAALVSNPASFLDIPVVVTAPSTSTPTPTPTPGGSFEGRVLTLTNAARAQSRTCGTTAYAAAPALTWNAQLAGAAAAHAGDMAAKNYFAHNSQDGRTPWDRIKAAGYTNYSNLAENIAAGQPTPEAVVDGWLKSPGHCANIMNKALKELGVGYATGGSYGSYWVQDFGTRF